MLCPPPIPALFPYTTLFRSDSRRLAVRTVVLARGDVAHGRLHHAHTHGSRAHADHADDVDLLGGDLPDLLAELDPLLLGHAERSEEDTSELQSRSDLVCRLL